MPASIKIPAGSRRVENCITWAVNKLLRYGAEFYHLPEGILMNRPVEYISSYEKSRDEAIEYRQKVIMVTKVVHKMLPYFGINRRRMKIPTLHLQGWSSLEDRVDKRISGSSAFAMGYDIFFQEMGRLESEFWAEIRVRIMQHHRVQRFFYS